MLKSDFLMDAHTANAYSRCGRIKALLRLIQFPVFRPLVADRNIDILFNAFCAFLQIVFICSENRSISSKITPKHNLEVTCSCVYHN